MILLDPLARPVIAHRGNRAHAPENTLEAFRQAVAAGADAIEFDLRLTKDGHVVVMHDATLDRTTDSAGRLELRTLEQLEDVDAGARFSNNGGWARPYFGRNVRIPTLDDLLDAMPSDLPLLMELKTTDVSEPVRRIIARRGIAKRVVVAGFSGRCIHPLRGSGFALGATSAEAAELVVPAIRGRPIRAGQYDAVCIPPRYRGMPVPLLAIARALKGTGKVLHVWTVNDPADAQRLWRGGVQGIVTDDPALMLAARQGV